MKQCLRTEAVALQTIRQLYELSTEQEALQLLADVTSLVKGLEPNGYPRR